MSRKRRRREKSNERNREGATEIDSAPKGSRRKWILALFALLSVGVYFALFGSVEVVNNSGETLDFMIVHVKGDEVSEFQNVKPGDSIRVGLSWSTDVSVEYGSKKFTGQTGFSSTLFPRLSVIIGSEGKAEFEGRVSSGFRIAHPK